MSCTISGLSYRPVKQCGCWKSTLIRSFAFVAEIFDRPSSLFVILGRNSPRCVCIDEEKGVNSQCWPAIAHHQVTFSQRATIILSCICKQIGPSALISENCTCAVNKHQVLSVQTTRYCSQRWWTVPVLLDRPIIKGLGWSIWIFGWFTLHTNYGWSVTSCDVLSDRDWKRWCTYYNLTISSRVGRPTSNSFESASDCATVGFVNERREEWCHREDYGSRWCAVGQYLGSWLRSGVCYDVSSTVSNLSYDIACHNILWKCSICCSKTCTLALVAVSLSPSIFNSFIGGKSPGSATGATGSDIEIGVNCWNRRAGSIH